MKVALSLAFAFIALAAHPPPTSTASGPRSPAVELEASFPEESILGEWWTPGKEGRMRFVKTKSGRYEALVAWGIEPELRDTKNPDPKLRNRKITGSVLIWHLKYEDGEYVDGYVYNPRDGNTYHMKARLIGKDTLKIRGYLAVPLLGQSQEWARAL
jgi:uncharacterized protein (DUF2147 family)